MLDFGLTCDANLCGRVRSEFGAHYRRPLDYNSAQLSERDLGMGFDMWANGGEKGNGTAGEGREGGVGVPDWMRVSVRRVMGAHKGRPYRVFAV